MQVFNLIFYFLFLVLLAGCVYWNCYFAREWWEKLASFSV